MTNNDNSSDSNNTPSTYEQELYDHIGKVRSNLGTIMDELRFRAHVHDASKMLSIEFETFERVSPKLRATTYGSDEYKELLKELGPALDHHYEKNDHHPEHFTNGINGMNLFQLTEMFCDWVAACEKHDDGDKMKSLEINRERFGIDDQLHSILKNTMIEWDLRKKESGRD